MKQQNNSVSRRAFIQVAASGGMVAGAVRALSQGSSAAVSARRKPDQKSVAQLRCPPLDRVRIGFIGVGGRGSSLLGNLLEIENVEIKAVCDLVPERVQRAQRRVVAREQPEPVGYADGERNYENLCRRDDVDVVYIATPWDCHVPMAVCAMKHGKHAAIEVPAAMTLAECWELVDTAEQTQRHCMMLENCCYGEIEMLVLTLVRQGVLGDLTHGECGYLHEFAGLPPATHKPEDWRWRFLGKLNGNLYPTHGLGPVAQYLGIHRGDKFEFLVSMSSRERAISRRCAALPADDLRRQATYACGDINTSLIKTALGRTIMVQYSTVQPRPYSRINLICGTGGTFCDYPPRLHLAGQTGDWETDLTKYHEQYGHPLWKALRARATKSGGHGGMDYVMNWRFIQCLREGLALDMSVYDAAAWSSVVPLSIASVAQGSQPVTVPDFTRGEWRG
ncbi:MAG: Gfo/Idh/MocA family oxidoreductase [Verrucomicrobia bacterium]|nr:Gfo/Idh/MocA family oxidoreductase [Verrucomicrobiota bacterium]